jgi:putative transposase
MARSSFYYNLKKTKEKDKYEEKKSKISDIYHENRGILGYRRITLALRNIGYKLNGKTVYRLMIEMGLKSMIRVKKYKSYRGDEGETAPNILNRKFEAVEPNEKLVTDITEFKLFGKKLYLSTILDLYNGEIISYEINSRPVFDLVLGTVKKALERLNEEGVKKPNSILLHSDQGWHYRMKGYIKILKENNITQSMSRKGNCLDNSVMENFFGHLKSELFYLQKFDSMEHFVKELEEYIDYWNNRRIKAKLNGLSPVQYRLQFQKSEGSKNSIRKLSPIYLFKNLSNFWGQVQCPGCIRRLGGEIGRCGILIKKTFPISLI